MPFLENPFPKRTTSAGEDFSRRNEGETGLDFTFPLEWNFVTRNPFSMKRVVCAKNDTQYLENKIFSFVGHKLDKYRVMRT